MSGRNSSILDLIDAAWRGNTSIVINLLATQLNPNTYDARAVSTPLLAAVTRNHFETAAALLKNKAYPEYKADPNFTGSQDIPLPIVRAIENNNEEMVELLISFGAKFDESFVDYAFRLGKQKAGFILLQYLLRNSLRDVNEFVRLVRKFPGFNINYRDFSGSTLLNRCMDYGNSMEIAKMLINNAEIDVNIPNDKNVAPLHRFLGRHVNDLEDGTFENKEVLDLLLSKGANIKKISDSGNTVFHYAATGANKGNVMPYLFEKYHERVGKYPSLTYGNKEGQIPIDVTFQSLTGYMPDNNYSGFTWLFNTMTGGNIRSKIERANYIEKKVLELNTTNVSTGEFVRFFEETVVKPLCKEIETQGNHFIDSMRGRVSDRELYQVGEPEAMRRFPPGSGPLAKRFYECFKKGAEPGYNLGGGAQRKAKAKKAKTRRVR